MSRVAKLLLCEAKNKVKIKVKIKPQNVKIQEQHFEEPQACESNPTMKIPQKMVKLFFVALLSQR